MSDSITFVQVSDTHLSRTHAWFNGNWPVFLGEVGRLMPDLVVNSGDLSFNGPDNADDLDFARLCHDRLPVPWLAIAGNHDVGEAPCASRLAQPVNDVRLKAWRDLVGPSWWARDLDRGNARLRLVGLDTALMGSGHRDEAAQQAFLHQALAERDGRAVLVFVHMPPFNADPDDGRITTHCILPEPRRWLLETCRAGGVAAIAAGHIHCYKQQAWQGLPIVTAPGTSFANLPASFPPGWSRARTGYLVWHYDGQSLSHRLVEPRLFMTVDASNWTDDAKTTTSLPPRPLSTLGDLPVFEPL
ncbi:MAG: metallophosphoesterase [Hyphomicrobiaceae bacterium]|nr:metallophosphoesterase [Hyphomicrobiaceae bacterium]